MECEINKEKQKPKPSLDSLSLPLLYSKKRKKKLKNLNVESRIKIFRKIHFYSINFRFSFHLVHWFQNVTHF